MNTKFLVDGTVLALAEYYASSRTGIYYVVSNLINALTNYNDLEFAFYIQQEYCPEKQYDLLKILPKALERIEFSGKIIGIEEIDRENDFVHIFSGFHPINSKNISDFSRNQCYQIFHDIAGHVCPEFKNDKEFDELRRYEKHLMSEIGNCHAFFVSKTSQMDICKVTNKKINETTVIYPGIKVPPITEKKISNEIYLTTVSTVGPRKNTKTTVEVFDLLNKYLPNHKIKLKIIGANEGEYFNSINEYVNSRGLSTAVEFTGYVNDQELYELIRSSACLIYPSLYEGFGLPPMDALCLQVPVVMSNRGSLAEIYGEYAYTFDPYDTIGMAKCCEYIICNRIESINSIPKLNELYRKFNWTIAASRMMATFETYEKFNTK